MFYNPNIYQMAHDMQHALDVAEDIFTQYSVSNLRLWLPRFSLAWLSAKPSTVVLDERGIFLDEEIPNLASSLSREEANQGIAEHCSISDLRTSPPNKITTTRGNSSTLRWYNALIYLMWNHTRTMRIRFSLSTLILSIEHSPHLRHAFKNAAGVAILSIPAFLPITYPGAYVILFVLISRLIGRLARQWFKTHHGQ